MTELQYDFRQPADPEGGLVVELHAEGQRIAVASVSTRSLTDMKTLLGLEQDRVRTMLQDGLVEQLLREHQQVDLTSPEPIASSRDRFVSRYLVRAAGRLAVGVVWYDASSSTTGPTDAPVVVRSKMRLQVRRLLAVQGLTPLARFVAVLHAMSE